MESISAVNESGTLDTLQRAQIEATLDAARLEQLYWEQVRRVTFGLARFSGGAIRLFGGWPVLLRLGPLVDGRRAILGGFIVREPGGSIAWKADGVHVAVEVEGFSPLLQGPLLRFEALFHDRVGRRFLARVAREVR